MKAQSELMGDHKSYTEMMWPSLWRCNSMETIESKQISIRRLVSFICHVRIVDGRSNEKNLRPCRYPAYYMFPGNSWVWGSFHLAPSRTSSDTYREFVNCSSDG